MRWADIEVKTTIEAQDAVSNVMLDNGCRGVAIQGDAPVVIECYLPVNDQLEERLLRIQAGVKTLGDFGLDAGPAEIIVRYAEDQDWVDAWKQFYHVVQVGRRIVIKPPWEEYKPAAGQIVVEIEPGMAFGTGTHTTTSLCLAALEKYLRSRRTVVDFGTGSGILAIAAAKLGASLVIAFDSDEAAVRSARKNVQRNEAEENIEVHQADSLRFIGTQVDMVVANLVAESITANAKELRDTLKTGGVLIASGVVDDKRLEVEQSLRNAGFDIAEVHTENNWVAIIARKAA